MALLESIQPATLRQLFYAATVRGLVPKTEHGYDLVGRRMSVMRRAGPVPFTWLVDNTRWMRKPESYRGLHDLLSQTATLYRRDLWQSADEYVEVWIEKDALSGVVYPITDEYDVPLMVARGYSSLSFLHSAAEAISAQRKPAYIYYFGDRDPSGVDIDRKIERDLRAFAPTARIAFSRMAVLEWQVEAWTLPTRPTKTTDSRAAKFAGESVELDAIPPDQLRQLVREVIEQHVDEDRLERLAEVEEQERATLRELAAGYKRNGSSEKEQR